MTRMWFIVEPTPILSAPKENRHAAYRQSEKGKQRDYRRYKKRLAARIIFKQTKLATLKKEIATCIENLT